MLPTVQAAANNDDWRGSTENGSEPVPPLDGSVSIGSRGRSVTGPTRIGRPAANVSAVLTVSGCASSDCAIDSSSNVWTCGVTEYTSPSIVPVSGTVAVQLGEPAVGAADHRYSETLFRAHAARVSRHLRARHLLTTGEHEQARRGRRPQLGHELIELAVAVGERGDL